MALTLALANAALKDDYQPELREQLNNEHRFLMQIESTSRDVEGRNAVLSLHIGRNSGVGARDEGDDLPNAGSQRYQEERVGMKHNYGRMQINGQVIKAMKSDRGSFVRAIQSETEGVVTDLKEDVSRQLFNDATKSIAECGTTTASATVQLAATTSAVQMRQFYTGQVVDIGTTADSDSVVAGAEITAVDRAASPPTITIDSSVTTAAGDYVTVAGSGGQAGNKELIGLREIVDNTGTLHNVDSSAVEAWRSYVDDNGGTLRTTTSLLFETAMDEIAIASGKGPKLIVTTHGVVRNYAAQLQDQRRFNDDVELKGGFSVPTVQAGSTELGLLSDRFCPANTAFVLNTDYITQHQMSDWEFMDEDGAVLNRVAGKDAYEATLFKYHELCTDRRNAHGIVKDLQES